MFFDTGAQHISKKYTNLQEILGLEHVIVWQRVVSMWHAASYNPNGLLPNFMQGIHYQILIVLTIQPHDALLPNYDATYHGMG